MKRVVTGVDDRGRSHVVATDELDTAADSLLVWEHDPGEILEWIQAIDPETAADWVEPAAAGGIKVLLGSFPPSDGTPHSPMPGFDDQGFHTTRTFDIAYIVAGPLVLLLDDERVRLEQGDIVIQRATRHAWVNEGDAPAVILGILHRPEAV